MEDKDYYAAERRLPAWMEQGRIEFLLRSEIAFWRDQVAGTGDALPPESVERMRQALSLAESRLQQLYRGGIRSSDGPVRTSERADALVN